MREVYACPVCPITITIDTGDPQEIGTVRCDCTTPMEHVDTEKRP